MELLDLINTKHPSFEEYNEQWDYYYRSFVGGHEYRMGKFLQRYWDEHHAPYDVYANRLKNTPFDNHVKTTIDVYRSFIFQTPPKRTLDGLEDNPFVEQWINDTDLDGQDIDSFIKSAFDWAMVLGTVWIGVDKPAYAAATAAEELAAGIRAYSTVYLPQNVRDWVYQRDETGRMSLSYLHIIEETSEEFDIIKLWTRENCRRIVAEKRPHSDEYDKILSEEEFENGLGYIPFVNVTPVRHHIKGIGHSLIGDVADMSRSIYNKLSELEQNIRLSVHPTLVKTEETRANAGAGGVIIMDEALPGDKNPFLLQPDGASIQGILDSIEHDVEAIDRMTHLTAVRAKKSGPASGVSLSVERQLLNSKLSDLADTVEEVEKQLWKMFLDWQYIETPTEFRIEYSRQYDMRDNQQELNLLIRSMDVITTPEYAEYVESEVAKMIIEDDDKLADILASIEAVDRTQPVDSQPEDSNPFGNI